MAITQIDTTHSESGIRYRIPRDLSELTDVDALIPDDVSDLTDTTGIVPTDVNDLADTDHLLTLYPIVVDAPVTVEAIALADASDGYLYTINFNACAITTSGLTKEGYSVTLRRAVPTVLTILVDTVAYDMDNDVTITFKGSTVKIAGELEPGE